jgi:outer membrane biosynthesis protein TonB
MKQNLIHSRKVQAAVCGVGLALGLVVFQAKGDMWDKKTTLTVNQEIQVTDRVLAPGTYVFKLLDSSSNRHVVQIYNADQSHIIDTVLAIPNYRLEPTGKSQFLFWETPPGAAPALRAWFYPGDNFGQEFRYPKHVAMLETAMNKPAPPPPAPPAAEPSPAPEPEPQPEPRAEAPKTEPAPQEMAQNTPPPPPAQEPEAQPAPAPPEANRELPHTASPFAAIGLGGLLAIGGYGLLQLRRVM